MKKAKCRVIDTNVPIVANLAIKVDASTDIPSECISKCIECIDQTINGGVLVLDADGEIFLEYTQNALSLKGAPGVGDKFIKWVHDHQWNPKRVNRVSISKNGYSYNEFPNDEKLEKFDNSDRKFVAVANAHHEKPPIYQATDSKWWGWRGGLENSGLTVHFLCCDYVKEKYLRKMGT